MLLTPLLGGPALRHPVYRRLYASALVVTAAVTTAWMLAQYAFQVILIWKLILSPSLSLSLRLSLSLPLTPVCPSCVASELCTTLTQQMQASCSCICFREQSMLHGALGEQELQFRSLSAC